MPEPVWGSSEASFPGILPAKWFPTEHLQAVHGDGLFYCCARRAFSNSINANCQLKNYGHENTKMLRKHKEIEEI